MLQKIVVKRSEKGNPVETQCLKIKVLYIYLQPISFQRHRDHAVIHVTMLLALLQRPILDINAHIFRLLSIVF